MLRMKILLSFAILIVGCNNSQKELYTSNVFTITANGIVENNYKVIADSPEKIRSNYKEAFEDGFNRNMRFKFCINGEDNETQPGNDHSIFLNPQNGKQISPLYVFGDTKINSSNIIASNPAPINWGDKFVVIFRVDMTEMISSFNSKGYYKTKTNTKITKEQFKFLSIAGSTPPLDWTFSQQNAKDELKFSDKNNDGIYELEIVFEKKASRKFEDGFFIWQLKSDLSSFPKYRCNYTLLEGLYNLSMEEMLLDIRKDGAFMAGEKWDGVWTRDISYSIILSLAAINPKASQKSLMAKVKNGIIIQDTGTGGSWPVSTDRMVWAIAAWEIFKVTGNMDWLNKSYTIIKNSTKADLFNVIDEETGLFCGESSFLDWREQTYPTWMDPKDIYMSKALGTNAVAYKVYSILDEMAKLLGDNNDYLKIANKIKNGINNNLWLTEQNSYAPFLYGRSFQSASKRSEALGTSLCVLFNVGSIQNQTKAIQNFPLIPYGVPTIYPQIPNIPNYHNNGIWPFVVSYYTWAAAKTGNSLAVEHGLASIYRSAGMFLTNKENMVAQNGSSLGTEINSDRQLWSVAGNLATIYRVFFGMEFQPNGIILNPFVPKQYSGPHVISNFSYRNSTLNITVEGYGNIIDEFYLDNQKKTDAFIPSELVGKHSVLVRLKNNDLNGKISLLENLVAVETPVVRLLGNKIKWAPIENAISYFIYKNGVKIESTNESEYDLKLGSRAFCVYQISAMGNNGYESFLSEPFENIGFQNQFDVLPIQTEKNPVLTTPDQNTKISFKLLIDKEGRYLLDFLYANGSGPLNTDNKCAIRTLYLDGGKIGTVVFPQRGTDLWDNWGYSNRIAVNLTRGNHVFELVYKDLNTNMNGKVNNALLKKMRLISFK